MTLPEFNYNRFFYYKPEAINRIEDGSIEYLKKQGISQEDVLDHDPPSNEENQLELQRLEKSINGLYADLTEYRLTIDHRKYRHFYQSLMDRFHLKFLWIEAPQAVPTNVITTRLASKLQRRQDKEAYFKELLNLFRICQFSLRQQPTTC